MQVGDYVFPEHWVAAGGSLDELEAARREDPRTQPVIFQGKDGPRAGIWCRRPVETAPSVADQVAVAVRNGANRKEDWK